MLNKNAEFEVRRVASLVHFQCMHGRQVERAEHSFPFKEDR